MSTFGGPVKELENVLIDNFVLHRTHTCFFLSHCHTDHMTGLDQLFSSFCDGSDHFIYCSPISRLILLNKYGSRCENLIKELTTTSVLTVPGNDRAPSYQVTVTPIPAGHCPGSIMFLFEALNKTVLYTGDFRILKDDIGKFKQFQSKNQIKIIDKLYFDSTFLNEHYWDFPSRSEVVAKLLNLIKKWISKSLNHNVLLETSALYGYEFVFVELARKLKYKVHIKDSLYELFWNVPEVGCYLTKTCCSTRLHAFVAYDEKCRALDSDQLLRVKLSAQWYKSTRNVSKQSIWKKVSDGRFVMCYSTHCSCSELVEFLNYLQPKSIEPCTVAVRSTKEDTKAYIEQLMSSWSIQMNVREDKESSRDDIVLEKNYKFQLKFPEYDGTESEDSGKGFFPEKKKKKVICERE